MPSIYHNEIFFLLLCVLFCENVKRCMSVEVPIRQNGGTSLLDILGLKRTSDEPRPKMYTFVYNEDPSLSYENDEYVNLWAESWSEAGWDPIILSEKDAISHPNYDDFFTRLSNSNIEKGIRWGRYLRYVAMSMRDDGGWYSEPYVLPLSGMIRKGVELPNDGSFTMYGTELPELLSGNRKEWNKLAFSVLQKPDKNDVLVLEQLRDSYPDLYIVEDSVIDAKYILDSNIKYDVCQFADSKLAAKFSYRIAHDAGIARSRYYHAVKSSLVSLKEKCERPKIYTFFEPAYAKKQIDRLLIELDGWKRVWKDAGWNPIVLTLEDAKLHPNFVKFNMAFDEAEYKTSQYDRMCFYRWLAMSAAGGGWMSDYDTYPLFSNPRDHGHRLPNGGKLTCYAVHVPCLVSGSQSEWNRITELIFFSYQMHTNEFWSDMLALEEIRKTLGGFIGLKETVTADQPYINNINQLRGATPHLDIKDPYSLKDACINTKGKRAIHFSHASCTRADFCHNQRDKVLGKWIDAWRMQCREGKAYSRV